jgi:hypothetical protein
MVHRPFSSDRPTADSKTRGADEAVRFAGFGFHFGLVRSLVGWVEISTSPPSPEKTGRSFGKCFWSIANGFLWRTEYRADDRSGRFTP